MPEPTSQDWGLWCTPLHQWAGGVHHLACMGLPPRGSLSSSGNLRVCKFTSRYRDSPHPMLGAPYGEMKEGTLDNMRLCILFFHWLPFTAACVYFFSNGYICGCVCFVPLWRRRVYTNVVCILFLQRLHLRTCILRPSMAAACVYFCRVYTFSPTATFADVSAQLWQAIAWWRRWVASANSRPPFGKWRWHDTVTWFETIMADLCSHRSQQRDFCSSHRTFTFSHRRM